MNEKLKILMDLIQKSETLKDKERITLLEELKAAEKDFEITAFKLERTEKVKKTTAILLEETIEELEQKRKAVEAQNRELEIEAALERIRTHNMAMQDSSELAETASVFFNEFKELGLLPAEARTYFSFIDSETDTASVWMTQADGSVRPGTHNVPLNDSKQLKKVYNAWKHKDPLIIRNMSGKDLDEYISFVSTLPHVQKDDALKKLLSLTPKRIVMTEATFRYGTIGIMTNELLSEETQNILIKFAKVFEQTYARFLDLKNAEARTREAQIEAALEKVRSSALAMTEPADMVEVCRIVSDQLELLGIKDIRNVQTVVIYEEKGTYLNYQYFTAYKKSAIEEAVYEKHPSANRMAQEMKKSVEAFYTDSFSGDELNIFREYRKNDGQFPDPVMDKVTSVHFYFFSIGMGALGISTYDKELSDTDVILFKRFRNVFELAYRRFVDIETALGQARESQIQLALERVRARTMAMHRSDELLETARVLYQQFSELGEDPDQLTIGFVNESERVLELWLSRLGNRMEQMFRVSIDEPVVINKIYTAWKEGKKSVIIDISGEELEKYNDFRKNSTDFTAYNEIKNSDKGAESRRVMHCAFFPKGLLSLATTEPRPEETVLLLERFAGVFDLTYTRFLDLQKAEAQARESEIQLALERVRARTMAMQKSEELAETAYELLLQFNSLGEVPDQITIGLINDQQKNIEFWLTLDGNKVDQKVILSAEKSEVINSLVQGWKDKMKSLTLDLSGQRLKEYQNYRNTISRNAGIQMPGISEESRRVIHAAYFSKGMLTFSSSQPQAESTLLLLERFAAVFDLTYTRFLDLQKAEAQAREAKIEASLEKVRSRAMAMNNSSDLSSASGIIFTELRKLGIASLRSGVVLLTKNSLKGNLYATTLSSESDELALIGTIMFSGHFCFEEQYEAWMKMENYFLVLTGEDLKSYYQVLSNQLPVQLPRKQKFNGPEYGYYFSFSEGLFYTWSDSQYSDKEINILNRFKAIIDLTFRRYLDLQKAEAQAKEAQIEAALEKVRSRTMGMQKSEELKEVIRLVYEQLVHLNIHTEHTGFILDYKTRDDLHIWLADEREIPSEITIPSFDSPPNNSIKEAKEKGENFFTYHLNFEEKNKFYQDLFKYIPGVPDESLEYYFKCPGLAGSGVLLDNIGLYIENFSGIPYTDEENNTLMRFGKVFQQTYTRFLDLQKAESQVREAQIEAALERVRSRTMAMQQSTELAETASDFFIQLNNLGINPYRCSIAIVDEQHDKGQLWSTTNEGKVIPLGSFIPLTENDVLIQMYEGWKEQKHRVIKITGEERIKWTEYIRKFVPFAEYMPENIDIEKLKSEAAVLSNFYFKQGFLVIHTSEEIADNDLKILQRFANVFEQTYTRFLDLKKAEAQAKEAIKQASLDRVRAEIASMRTADDLNRITPIIWHELKALEVPFIRCGLYIIDEEQEKVHVYLTTPDGKALGVLNLLFNANEVTRNTVEHWRAKKVFKDFWDKQGFIKWTKSMIELGQVDDAVTYQGSAEPPDSLHLHFVPFNQGMLYVGDTAPLSDDKLQLVHTLAEAFSIAYARYEDFQNLEAAKNRIEITLSELKSTQAQLLHAEKMASLGELTAGIAHEIKNPLNFVNNFSEVSRELLDEMNVELKNNNVEEVIEMIEDLKQNLEKINHHGKRADLIIKSMLLHSRGSSGEKVLTNINELLDQYVVLAYHGMRAQNKEFNISIEKDYDESIPKINVVPQDMSRVFLNIVNNACYATHDKKKNNGEIYSPLLKVSTKNLKDKIEIRIEDNGNGIPSTVKENIFNPFFTTKPTGEGTGLGLSLSYDIVTKVHGGDIKVESEVGKGAGFIIQLPLT